MSIAGDSIQGTPETTDEYDEMVPVLDEIIELGLSKLTGDGRIKDTKKANAHAEYMKRTEQAIRAKRQVVKDKHPVKQEMGEGEVVRRLSEAYAGWDSDENDC